MVMEINVLALGEGNFSFGLALATQINGHDSGLSAALKYLNLHNAEIEWPGITFIFSSFDSRQQVIEKYPESKIILKKLQMMSNVTVIHGVNAWELKSHFPDRHFDVIFWNHPHLGTENFKLHRFLMSHFLNSAKSVLTVDGSIVLSLVCGQETRWSIVGDDSVADQASTVTERQGLRVESINPFMEQEFDGYICKRNKNGQSFKNIHTQKHVRSDMRSFTFRLVRKKCCETESLVQQFKVQNSQRHSIDSDAILKMENMTLQEFNFRVFDPQRDKLSKKSVQKSAASFDLKYKTDSSMRWQCPDCQKIMPSLRSVTTHYHMIHRLQVDGDTNYALQQIKCKEPECNRMFTLQKDMLNHYKSKHVQLDILQFEELMRSFQLFNYDMQCVNEGKNVDEYQYKPCEVCGQAVMLTSPCNDNEPLTFGERLHLEQLKPVLELGMNCPLKCETTKTFMDHRALEQHIRQCQMLDFSIKYKLS